MANTEDNADTTTTGSHRAARAYADLLSEIEAVPNADLIPIKIDVMLIVGNVLGALPEITRLRPEMEGAFKLFDFTRFDKLEQYARAMHHAHALWRAASKPKADLVDLATTLNDERERLLTSAEALAVNGLVDGSRLKEIKKVSGYRALAADVATLVELIRERWSVIQHKTPLSLTDLDRQAELALDLVAAVGTRDQATPSVGEASLNRQRAFTLFVRAYEDARRAVSFLRPDAADDIAPSLYAGRGGRKPNEPVESDDETVDSEEATAAATPTSTFVFNNPTGLPATPPLT